MNLQDILKKLSEQTIKENSSLTRQLNHLVKYWVMEFNSEEVSGNIQEQRARFVDEIINIITKEAE